MALSMVHWNENQVCAIDVETTGLEPYWHEIWQLSVIPLDSNLEIRKDIIPFDLRLCIDHPERIKWRDEVMITNKKHIIQAMETGIDAEKAKTLFEEWMKKLHLPLRRGSDRPARIIPLGHNVSFDIVFLRAWLGNALYEEWFHPHYRDTMVLGAFLNDVEAFKANPALYPKLQLSWIAKRVGVTVDQSQLHNALYDCRLVAETYRKLCLLRGGLV